MAQVDERRASEPADPPWLRPAEALAQARDELKADRAREMWRQGVVLRSFLGASILHSPAFAGYFLSLDEPVQRLAALISAVMGLFLAGAIVADMKGHRTAAGVASQLIPVPAVLAYSWIFSVEAGLGSYLFISALGLVVLVPENCARTRYAVVAILVTSILFLQFTCTRERALAPLGITETTALATVNRTIMSLSLFTLAVLLNRSVRAARVLVASSLAISREEADSDVLTGLPHRRPTWERVRRLSESNVPFTLALVDVDHFKRLNDAYGHEAGDQALVTLGRALASAVREQDIVGRWGGEEFLLVISGHDDATARAIKRVHAEVSGLMVDCGGEDVSITISVGYAGWRAGDDPCRTLRRADHALYAAKRAGRNRVMADSPETADHHASKRVTSAEG